MVVVYLGFLALRLKNVNPSVLVFGGGLVLLVEGLHLGVDLGLELLKHVETLCSQVLTGVWLIF